MQGRRGTRSREASAGPSARKRLEGSSASTESGDARHRLNDEIRMTNDEASEFPSMPRSAFLGHSSFVIPSSFVIRASSFSNACFVIFPALASTVTPRSSSP
jgi:hypothetical protein